METDSSARLSQFIKIMESFADSLIENVFEDIYPALHFESVGAIAYLIAKKEGLLEEECQLIKLGGKFHDIGKANSKVNYVLHLTSGKKLDKSSSHFHEIKKHVDYGNRFFISLRNKLIEFDDYIESLRIYAYYHHVRFDGGNGSYPEGIKQSAIPNYGIGIIQVADCISAMMQPREYSKQKSIQEIIDDLLSNSGTVFNPNIANSAIFVLNNKHENPQ